MTKRLLLSLFCLAFAVRGEDLPADHAARMSKGLEIFQKQVKGILVENCVTCHGGDKVKAELNMVTREGLLKGGVDGVVVVPFKAKESRLLRLVRHEEEPNMPDKKPKLADEKIKALEEWIENGAPYEGALLDGVTVAKEKGTVSEEDRKWWAFQPLKKVKTPEPPEGGTTYSGGLTEPPKGGTTYNGSADREGSQERGRASVPASFSVAGHSQEGSRGRSRSQTQDANDNAVDRFIAAKAGEKKLAISPKAERRVLIRRLYLDLLGLPPTPEEVQAFVEDSAADAWDRLIDRTLASPHYGERWARHWLDVARFAESSGFEHDYDREGAYQFRDFVIRALNADMPFDQFLKWQIAGDEFEPENAMALAATGFLGSGVFPTQITANEVERTRYDAMDDMLGTTSLAFMGLTVGCARCHDHKFDPFPTADYYRLLSTFTTTTRSVLDLDVEPVKNANVRRKWLEEQTRFALDLSEYEAGLREQWLKSGAAERGAPWARVTRPSAVAWVNSVLPFDLAAMTEPLIFNAEKRRQEVFEKWRKGDGEWRKLAARAEAHEKNKPWLEKTLICGEGYTPLRMHTQGADFFNETYLLRRGNTDAKQGVANQDFLQVMMRAPERGKHWKYEAPQGAKFSGRRRSLANWMTDMDAGAGAQVARVIVNRLWQHHFGQGIVATPNDFGHAGAAPTHPELLEWLAGELVRNGWRLKPIHKLMLKSATYQQNTIADAAKQAADPENRLFVRRLPRRLEGEALRDSVLAVTGALDPKMYGPGTKDEASVRRSIYFTVKRSQLVGSMVVFDLPEPLVSQAVRPTTTVAPQALFLMNAPEVREWAKGFAKRLESEETPEGKVRRAFLLAIGREPNETELADSAAFLKKEELADFCQVVLGLNEFAYEN